MNREEAKSQDENDEESTYDEEKADSEEEFKDLPRQKRSEGCLCE